jgi:hypothetical protein
MDSGTSDRDVAATGTSMENGAAVHENIESRDGPHADQSSESLIATKGFK